MSKLFRSCFARVVGLRPRSVLLEFTPSGLEAALRYCLEKSTRYGLESPRTGRILACRDEPRARLIAVALARMCQGEVCRLEDFSDWRACLQHLAQLGQLRVRQRLLEWLSGWSHHSGHEEWFTLLVEGSPTPAMLHAACELRAIRDDLPIHQVGRDEDCDIIFPLGQSLGQKRYSIPTGEEPANFDLDDVASRFWLLQKPRRLALSRGLSREEGTFPRVEAALRGLRALPEHPVPQGLELPAEGWALARRVEHFPWLVAGIGDSPHRLASYVSTVAREALDYLDRNESFDPAELALLQGVRIVIERGLEMLGLA
ncbi:MAG: hypothetical protein KC910_04985 [Candidatus Eremiobacteraeota bacterium]|nr:hypothetical protein [Candidatus Eremiobacteraeota bacterium]